MQTKKLPLIAVESRFNIDQGRHEHKPRPMYLHLVEQASGYQPITLGTGRNAVVFLATDYEYIGPGAGFRAVKFLRDDPDDQVAYGLAIRFLLEAMSLQKKSSQIPSLVNFMGWGAIVRDLTRRGRANSVKEFWWEDQFDLEEVKEEVVISKNDGEEYRMIKNRFNLQGPFYCLELCQGTLEQLLERNQPWVTALPVYKYDAESAKALQDSASEIRSDIEKFSQRYLQKNEQGEPLSLDELAAMSGYDILNSFKTKPVEITDKNGRPLYDAYGPVKHDPNVVRNYAVLQLFKRIVQSVQILHEEGKGEAHRDLKPGNIFFRHYQNLPVSVDVKLGDLGYVTRPDIIQGGQTLKEGTEYAPGSPFFRAPEQADLPIEVRIDVKESQIVTGKNSKISEIQPSDWLFVADIFEDDTNYHASARSLDGQDIATKVQAWYEANPEATREQIENEIKAELDQFHTQLLQYVSANSIFDRNNYPLANNTIEQRGLYRQKRFFKINKADVQVSGAFSLEIDGSIDRKEITDLQAQISKSTGFHTDVYSLGAILYDLVSGGRNPEHFYTYCLKVFTEQFGVSKDLIPSSIDDVMNILWPPPDRIKTRIGAKSGHTSTVSDVKLGQTQYLRAKGDSLLAEPTNKRKRGLKYNRWRVARFPRKPDQVNILIEEILNSSFVDLPEKDQNRWLLVRLVMKTEGVDKVIEEILKSSFMMKDNDIPEEELQSRWRLAWQLLTTNDVDQQIKEILKSSFTNLSEEDVESRWRLAWQLLTTDNIDDLIEDILKSAFIDEPKEETDKRIRDYRFRTFDVVNTLLKDKRGEKIPREIVEIIVRCMLHAKTGSFCQISKEGKGWTAKANDILIAVNELLDTTFGYPATYFPDNLKIDLLFRLRALSFDPKAVPDSIANTQPETSTPTTAAKEDDYKTRVVGLVDQDMSRGAAPPTPANADQPTDLRSPVTDSSGQDDTRVIPEE